MADGINFDLSEVTQLAADLGEVPKTAGPFINSALQHTAVEVKKEAARTVSEDKFFKQAASAISYDTAVFHGFGVSVLKVDIGYDKTRPAGKLGNLREFGAPGSPNSLAPHNDLANALHSQEEDFQKGLGIALDDAAKAHGL